MKNLEYDWILVEVREKGSHLFGSNWIGELELQIKQFSDGKSIYKSPVSFKNLNFFISFSS